MGYRRNYTVFDRAVIDPVWEMRWPDLFAVVPRAKKDLTHVIGFCLSLDTPEEKDQLHGVLQSWRVRDTIHRASPQSLLMSDLLYSVQGKLGGSVQFGTRYLSDAQCLMAAVITGFLRRKISAKSAIPIIALDDGDYPCLQVPSKVRSALSLASVGSAVERARSQTIYRWQGRPKPMGDLPEIWLRVRETTALLSLLWQAWDENWELDSLSVQDSRDSSVSVARGSVPRFRDFETARLFQRSRRRIQTFMKPAMFMDIT